MVSTKRRKDDQYAGNVRREATLSGAQIGSYRPRIPANSRDRRKKVQPIRDSSRVGERSQGDDFLARIHDRLLSLIALRDFREQAGLTYARWNGVSIGNNHIGAVAAWQIESIAQFARTFARLRHNADSIGGKSLRSCQ